MKPILVGIFAGLVAVGLAAVVSAPTVARLVAEHEVDKALKQIRKHNTSVVDRGDVSVDLGARAVSVNDIFIDSPGDGADVGIGRITITRPQKDHGLLTAERVVIERVRVVSVSATVVIPRIEISDYSGPARGLVTTPGIGQMARSQAEVIAQVSLAAASAPLVTVAEKRSGVRRAVRNVAVGRVSAGVVDRATVASIAIDAPDLSPNHEPDDRALNLTTGEVVYERLSLPALWRFYAGAAGPAGDRAPLVKRFSASRIRGDFRLRPAGHVSFAADEVFAEDVDIRPLSGPAAILDEVGAKLRSDEKPTPADIRQQISLATEIAGAAAFRRIGASGIRAEADAGQRKTTTAIGAISIGPYADARLENFRIEGLDHSGADGVRIAASRLEASSLDATSLAAWAERVGRDEILMTTAPTADDVVRIAPRIRRIAVDDLDAAVPDLGALKAASAQIDVDAPPERTPQHVAFRLDGLDAAPAAGSWFDGWLKAATLDRLRGSSSFSLTFDPNHDELSLDALDYDFEKLGAVTAKGALADVDARIWISTGAAFLDKLEAVTLETFKITARNDGVAEIALAQAADRAGQPREEFREWVAQQAEAQMVRLLGPPAKQSGEALAEFIRDPHSIEITVAPKPPETRLIDFLRSLALGPEGVAQTIDLTVLNRR